MSIAAEIEQGNLSALLSISSSELFLTKKADTAKTPLAGKKPLKMQNHLQFFFHEK